MAWQTWNDPTHPELGIQRRRRDAMLLPKSERFRELERIDEDERAMLDKRRRDRRDFVLMYVVVPLVIVVALLGWIAFSASGSTGESEPAFNPDNPPTCVWHTGMGAC